MEESFPDSFDVVVCGTGLIESMVAAALARVDKKVLHIDRNDYYGGEWATFGFDALCKYFEKPKSSEANTESCQNRNIPNKPGSSIQNVVIKSNLPETDENTCSKSETDGELADESNEKASHCNSSIVSAAKVQQGSKDITVNDLHMLSRKFNLDLCPKFLLSAGPLVNSIVKANIAHYAEFKLVDRILVYKDDVIVEAPCNRADVFTSSILNVLEKRTLMKFLTWCMEVDTDSEDFLKLQNTSFQEFLTTRKLSKNLQNFLIYSIAMVKPLTDTAKAIVEMRTFLSSVGRFGKSPFLWPLFGVGELPQAFCRMCAVFGGLYMLRKDLTSINIENGTCKQVIFENNETVNCEYVVMDSTYVPLDLPNIQQRNGVSRSILITNKSLLPSNSDHVSFLTIPPNDEANDAINVIEIGAASSACPNGLHVLHLTCPSIGDAYKDLHHYAEMITSNTNESKPKVLWSVYFNHVDQISYADKPNNLFVTQMPGFSINYSDAVTEAEKIFKSICPDAEFMLRVPNPDEIIWDHSSKAEE